MNVSAPVMRQDDDLLAEAQAIMRAHGDRASRWVAERTVALNLVGHEEGVHRYRRIAALLESWPPAELPPGD